VTRWVLVTGGAGFIGSHLCARLLDAGDQVTCIDDFSTAGEDNLAGLAGRPGFEVLRHDVTRPFDDLAFDGRFERIYNMACPASPWHYQMDPVRTTRTSVLGALNILQLAERHGARVLQASTSEVYGDPLVHPQREDYWGNVNPIGPRACYDEGKRCAETLFADYHRHHGLSVRIARIFNTYGPRMQPDDGRVIPNFIWQALHGKPLTLYGDGSQTRSFCYVEDLVGGLIALMETEAPGAADPVNLGNPIEVTIAELASLVLRQTNSSSTIDWQKLPQDDPRQRRPDIGRIQALTGWTPSMALEDGLARTISYFRRRAGLVA